MWEAVKREPLKIAETGTENATDPFERSRALMAQRRYQDAFKENQRVLSEHRGLPDIALFNMGVISAHSQNPDKDYPTALGLFNKVIKEYPQSTLSEPAKLWIQVIEEQQKLVEDKRSLKRERELLFLEKEKLKTVAERSQQVDVEIEKRRRQRKAP